MDTSLVHTSLWEIVRLPLVEICIVGALAGLVGVFAVLKRRVFFAESVTHGTFPGAVLGVVVGSSLSQGDHHVLSLWLFAGAFALCVPLAGVMYALARIPGQSSQAAAGVVLTVGFALGYFLNTWFAPLPLKIEGFLAGSVLNVNVLDVSVAFAVLAVVMVIVVATVSNSCSMPLMSRDFGQPGSVRPARNCSSSAWWWSRWLLSFRPLARCCPSL